MIAVFLGPPGCGKGTQAARLSAREGFVHFDMGRTLRSEIESGSDLGKEIRTYTDRGELAPLPIIKLLVTKALKNYDGRDLILDGFPRSSEQADLLDDVLVELGSDLAGVFYFVLDDGELVIRVVNRRFCPECGRVYNLVLMPPQSDEQCDEHAIALEKRPDDSEDVLKTRLQVYRRETEPILAKYRAVGLLKDIDARQSIERIEEDVLAVLRGRQSWS